MTVQVIEGPDTGAVWHYGDPFREQRDLVEGRAGVDFSHRPVFTVGGRDRLTWLNDITSQAMLGLAPGEWDPGWWVLVALRRMRLVWNVRLPADLPPRPELGDPPRRFAATAHRRIEA